MYVAIDIGGRHVRIATSELLDNPTFSQIQKFPITNNYAQDLAAIISTITSLKNDSPIDAIGIGFPGVISKEDTRILKAPNLSDWIDKPFAQDIERAFHTQVSLENDTTNAALAEATYGYGKGKTFLYLTWGTGFDGATVVHVGDEITVAQFEAGHHIIEWKNGKLCGCGQRGCAEAYIGGGNIEKYFQKVPSALTQDEWNIVENYAANTLLNIVIFHPTSLVILGGGVAIHQKDRVDRIKEKVKERLTLYPLPEIRITSLGDNIGLYGALALLKK
ncbi:MAG TPA: ROK family protein [Candidatus Eisenbacteria bacterium]|nr:ROK family protein [Candidatus Eisenbacteria bacterium]